MPTCPGCQQTVSHRELADHQRHCTALGHGIGAGAVTPVRSLEALVDRLDDLERAAERRRPSELDAAP